MSGCQLTSNLARYVRGLFADASSASYMPIEHALSTTILKAKALRLSNAHVPPFCRGTRGSVLVVPHRVVFTIMEARQH